MQREIKVGSISWINDKPNPIWSTVQAVVLDPDWIPKTYVGLAGTSNGAPPDPLSDFKDYQSKKDFRALTYCHLVVDIDEAAQTVTGVTVKDAVHDPGWTPTFSMTKFPSTLLSFDLSIYDPRAFQGEASPLSVVNTQARHANTVIKKVPADETVLVDALIKFRAGKHTDDVGINNVKAPFHVPWVWCETVLTYAKGKFKMYGCGSIFPCHAWYFNGGQVNKSTQAADTSFPMVSKPIPMPPFPVPMQILNVVNAISSVTNQIDKTAMKIYPVLSKGAPASGPQWPLSSEKSLSGAVDTHAHTAGGIQEWSKIVA
jgi:hypothetical protein